MRHTVALCLSALVAFTGCASYRASLAPIPKPGSIPVWQIKGAVAVGADPYVQPDRLQTVFDTEPTKWGILPVQVFVQNQGDGRLWVRRSEIALELADGGRISPEDAHNAAYRISGERIKVLFPHYAQPGCIAGCGLILFTLLAVKGATNISSSTANSKRLTDFQKKEIRDVVLEKDESVHGFVYFPWPSEAEATLKVSVLDIDEGSRVVVRLPLSELGLKETLANSEE